MNGRGNRVRDAASDLPCDLQCANATDSFRQKARRRDTVRHRSGHGKNFCAATWQTTIAALADAGYRVTARAQIGLCKSSQPRRCQFSFRQRAVDSHALPQALALQRATLTGHSTGAMPAVRHAPSQPGGLEHLVRVNPIGLEDLRAKGAP